MTRLTIRSARFLADTPAIREQIREYIATIDENACRNEVESGLAALPAPYDTAGNGFLLAEYGESVAGGVAFARDLVSRALAEAAAAGHRRMVLHTLPQWHAARALYGTMAFEPIQAYEGVQVAEAVCYARDTKLSGT